MTILLAAMYAAPLFTGGQQEAVSSGGLDENVAGGSVSISDCMGREVTVNGPVKRIAFCHFATGEALKILDAWGLVTGRSAHGFR